MTAAIAITKDDVTLTGYRNSSPHQRSSSVIVNATDVNTITIDANDVTLENFTLDDNVATATADTAAIAVNTASSATDYTGTVIRNVYIDMEGADTDRDGITLGLAGDASDGAIRSLVEGCVIWDCGQDAIVVATGSENCVIKNNFIKDDHTITTRFGVEVVGTGCWVDGNVIEVSDTSGACVHLAVAASKTITTNNQLSAVGANTIGIAAIATATGRSMNNWITALAAGNLNDYVTDNTTPSADCNISGIFAATPGVSAFDNVTVDGS